VGQDECSAVAGALLGGDEDGDGKDISAANLDWTAAGAIGEEVVDRERDTMRRYAITEKSCLVTNERDFVVERQRLRESIDRFSTGGPGVCTNHPLTPVEWAALMYQHVAGELLFRP
jgi:hypothetical protein